MSSKRQGARRPARAAGKRNTARLQVAADSPAPTHRVGGCLLLMGSFASAALATPALAVAAAPAPRVIDVSGDAVRAVTIADVSPTPAPASTAAPASTPTGATGLLEMPQRPQMTGNMLNDFLLSQAYSAEMEAYTGQAAGNAIVSGLQALWDRNSNQSAVPTGGYARGCLGVCLGAAYQNDGTNGATTFYVGLGWGASAGPVWGPPSQNFEIDVQGRASYLMTGWASVDGMLQVGYNAANGLEAAGRGTVSLGPPFASQLWLAAGAMGTISQEQGADWQTLLPLAAGYTVPGYGYNPNGKPPGVGSELSGVVAITVPDQDWAPFWQNLKNAASNYRPPDDYTIDGIPVWYNTPPQQGANAPAAMADAAAPQGTGNVPSWATTDPTASLPAVAPLVPSGQPGGTWAPVATTPQPWPSSQPSAPASPAADQPASPAQPPGQAPAPVPAQAPGQQGSSLTTQPDVTLAQQGDGTGQDTSTTVVTTAANDAPATNDVVTGDAQGTGSGSYLMTGDVSVDTGGFATS